MRNDDLLYALALQHVPKIGDIIAKKLINHCGSPEAVLKEKRHNLLRINGIGTSTIQNLFDKSHLIAAENELIFIEDNDIKCLLYNSQLYPEKLKHCIDGPIVLFQSGSIDFQEQPVISIVGTRRITSYGMAFCEKLVEELAVFNPIIVSGFAYGTDITAQKAAIKHDLQTIGCLAHGLNQIYPQSHKKYINDVEKNGGFLTDFWSTDAFERNNFLKRNRIIAGISEATIVIESADKGGSLVTTDIAISYDREVFAVPGRTTDSQSVGCNNLIKHQKAHVLSQPLDVPYILNWNFDKPKKGSIQKQLFVELNKEEKKIYEYLKSKDKHILDSISNDCQIPVFKVASLLLNMELKGIVRPLPGKQFEII